MFRAMNYSHGCLNLLDQRKLPLEEVWLSCKNLEQVANAIENMTVRGAPAIGCAAAFGLVVHLFNQSYSDQKNPGDRGQDETWQTMKFTFFEGADRLKSTRPTAVNLFYAINAMNDVAKEFKDLTAGNTVLRQLEDCATKLFNDDLATCQAIGQQGSRFLRERIGETGQPRLNIMTHCNTGSLATAGYGTALGVIRSLHGQKAVENVYVNETRPWLQGARLTAFELQKDQIPFSINIDSAAGSLMAEGSIDLLVVGADRIAANGDSANKIGTYGLAVLCHYHHIPFFIAAPMSTVDPGLSDGGDIVVEERSELEILTIAGRRIAPPDSKSRNPSFDVTPANLISGIITEHGVYERPYDF